MSFYFLIHHDFYQLTNNSQKQYKIFINHIGFHCETKKQVIIEDCPYTTFEIQDMSRVVKEDLGEYEGDLYIAVHAVVKYPQTGIDAYGNEYTYYDEETAWADTYGIQFTDSGWALYLIVEI